MAVSDLPVSLAAWISFKIIASTDFVAFQQRTKEIRTKDPDKYSDWLQRDKVEQVRIVNQGERLRAQGHFRSCLCFTDHETFRILDVSVLVFLTTQ
ncbi:hypothetical protein RvY_12875 [Ramazzottius varieornatus]|uniref:Uncharacterized protein n=1 Tax=Ramazzottius varieornatus TaxID=947166 RepID=A0A1D1VN83_RAMVA|nr:hypothetical protein RvY_12875 [Ramazzottius varieornatus]